MRSFFTSKKIRSSFFPLRYNQHQTLVSNWNNFTEPNFSPFKISSTTINSLVKRLTPWVNNLEFVPVNDYCINALIRSGYYLNALKFIGDNYLPTMHDIPKFTFNNNQAIGYIMRFIARNNERSPKTLVILSGKSGKIFSTFIIESSGDTRTITDLNNLNSAKSIVLSDAHDPKAPCCPDALNQSSFSSCLDCFHCQADRLTGLDQSLYRYLTPVWESLFILACAQKFNNPFNHTHHAFHRYPNLLYKPNPFFRPF